MRRNAKYSPHLMTISETSTMAPTPKQQPQSRSRSPSPTQPRGSVEIYRRVGRSQSAPPDVEREPPQRPSPPPRTRSTTDAATSECSSAAAAVAAAAAAAPACKYGRSPLHNAVRKGDKEAILRLIKQQPALLRTPDARGNLPLHYAVSPAIADYADVVYTLLRAGSPVNVCNARGQSPLVVFAISSEEDDDLVPRMLLHFHARPLVRVTADQTLAPYAAGRGLLKVAAAIREYI